MARAVLPGRLTWQFCRVIETVMETSRAKSIVLEPPSWPGHLAGQHVDVRVTFDDGYQAERSYSIASGPEDRYLVLTVERIGSGVVSAYLVDQLRAGDELEVRGPVGGYFVWEKQLPGPLLLVAAGAGIVPFRSMLRHCAATGDVVDLRLLYSSRSLEDAIYRDELIRFAAYEEVDMRFTLTTTWPASWRGYRRGVDREMLQEVGWPAQDDPLIYVCGPGGFVEQVARSLTAIGHQAERIRTERFGPSGSLE
jgi:ferredoxin-NADP reductase